MSNQDLILTSPTAQRLYSAYAQTAPIYDYHCHLSAKEILEDKVFTDIADMWLGHDHYKWRAMRQAGVAEALITGSAAPADKFRAFARTVARLVGCPLYDWVHLELDTYFGIAEPLDEKSADRIYRACNKSLRERSLRPSDLIRQSNVQLIGTTDDPTDDLAAHFELARCKPADCRVIPTFRPDRALNIQKAEFADYLASLADCAGYGAIRDFAGLVAALRQRVSFFGQAGCLMSDHSLEALDFVDSSREQADAVLKARLSGKTVSADEARVFSSQLLVELAGLYTEFQWVMQLHVGALRNVSSRMFARLGADKGFDVMNDFQVAVPLAALLNRLESKGTLPATILYTLNSKDNLVLSTLPQCFADSAMPGKIQFGAAWWFNDTQGGIESHIKSLAEQGILPTFIGMLTDSRSFLSYTRHDYFRRILCQFIGERFDRGEYRASEEILKELVEGICYKNIVRYLHL